MTLCCVIFNSKLAQTMFYCRYGTVICEYLLLHFFVYSSICADAKQETELANATRKLEVCGLCSMLAQTKL
jgi:hypothetical protein